MDKFTHIDEKGNAIMVDVGEKAVTSRQAVASGRIRMSRECFDAVRSNDVKKGDVLGVARIAGIQKDQRSDPPLSPAESYFCRDRI